MEKRNYMCGVRLTDKERDEVAKEAEDQSRTMSSYFRWLHKQYIDNKEK